MRSALTAPVSALVLSGIVLVGCGWKDSRINPTNWFGGSTEIATDVVDEGPVNPLIPTNTRSKIFSRPEAEDKSVPIQSVTELRVEPAGSGAIVYAKGLATRQGAFGAELRPEPVSEDAPSALVLTFRVNYPQGNTPAGAANTREVVAAYHMSPDDLKEISLVRVVGAENARETRRK